MEPDPKETVTRFLRLMEARELQAAEALLAPGFTMTFPGGQQMTRLDELLAWAQPRYAWVRKRFDRVEQAGAAVWVTGTLEGEWPDGAPFAGIRYVDRFEIADGLIARQEVWNDMGEARAAR